MVTMRDVARRAGVSIATVSFVVNKTKPVTPTTRAKVESAMEELGFRRNVLARALASQRTRIVALVFPALEHRLGSTAMSIVTSAAVTASERGFNLVLWPVSSDPGQLEEYVSGGLVDGVVLMEVTLEDPRIAVLERRGMPYGLMGRTSDPGERSYVDMDFEGAVRQGVEHLVGLGHSRIALLIGELDAKSMAGYSPIVRSATTFREDMAARGLDPVVVTARQNTAAGRDAARRFRHEHPDVTGVLVLNEEALYGFVGQLGRDGVGIPDDVSILGLAISPDPNAMADPAVSAFVAPGVEMGRLAVTSILARLEDPESPPIQQLVPMTYLSSGTTGPSPS